VRRGEVYQVVTDRWQGLVLVMSNNANNRGGSKVTVLPISRQVERVFPFEVRLELDEQPAKVQAHLIETVPKTALTGGALTLLDDNLMQQVDAAVRLHLSL
jgi:mRNA interferase MazF